MYLPVVASYICIAQLDKCDIFAYHLSITLFVTISFCVKLNPAVNVIIAVQSTYKLILESHVILYVF